MEKISKPELVEILKSYGLCNLIFDFFRQVEPDTAIYVFHDEENIQYCLVAADYLFDDAKMPYYFEYSYYSNAVVKFRAIKQLSYIENAPKKAVGYIDDEKHRTKASTGDVCMLYVIDDLELK